MKRAVRNSLRISSGLMMCLIAIGTVDDSALAQANNDPRERLRRLLERKMPSQAPAAPAPRTRSAFPPATGSAPQRGQRSKRPDEVIIIRPDGKFERAPTRAMPNRRSRIIPEGEPLPKVAGDDNDETALSGIWRQIRSLWPPAERGANQPLQLMASSDALPSGAGPRSGIAPVRSEMRRFAQSSNARRRSAAPLGVVPDTFILQFKYSASETEIDTVLRRYNLEVLEGGIPKIGILRVRQRPFGRTRSIAPEREKRVEDVIEPAFLKRLRKEPGVNAATVEATISPKSIPRPSDTTVKDAGHTYSWTWRPGVTDDGNWGLKRMRIPVVWRILESYRKHGSQPVRMSFLDSGFSTHPHIKWRVVHGLKAGERLIAFDSTCVDAHGTHVAGIAGAAHGLGKGTDGIVPNALLDAIPLDGDGIIHGAAAGIVNADNQNFLLFTTALGQLIDYLDSEPVPDGGRRVVNVSLGHNWRNTSGSAEAANGNFKDGDLANEIHRTFILAHAQILRQSLKRYEKDTLFVVAAGNDSEGLEPPLKAKWSSPFAYLGLENSDTFQAAPNVLVVEAVDRTGRRAPFSNTAGHVSAPGVDIMSTIGGRRARYAICEGTSQSAPHVTAVASILLELAPEKSPADIAELIKASAVPDPTGSVAPRVDALEAVLKARPEALTVLADLNNDGIVDADDLATYRRHREAMTSVFKSTLGTYFLDLNDNGQIEDNEHWWPRIDLNGSGLADLRPGEDQPRCLGGKPAFDLDVIKRAWQGDSRSSFSAAISELGLKSEAPSEMVAEVDRGRHAMSRLSASTPSASTSTAPTKPGQCSW